MQFEQDDGFGGQGSGEGVAGECEVFEGGGFDLFGGGEGIVGGDGWCGEDGALAGGWGKAIECGGERFWIVGVSIDEGEVDGAVF